MSALRALKKLILGETWILPLGVATIVLTAALVARPLLDDHWRDAGGPLLVAGVAAVLWVSVARSAGR